MGTFVEESKLGSSLDKLASSAVKEVAICVRRQMDEVEFLRDDTTVDEDIPRWFLAIVI